MSFSKFFRQGIIEKWVNLQKWDFAVPTIYIEGSTKSVEQEDLQYIGMNWMIELKFVTY